MKTSSAPERPAEPGNVDRVRFVQRVARAFEALNGRTGPVRLRLSPPELGSMRLEISVRNGMMTARLEAETPMARNLLLDNLPALRDRLAQQDIKIEQFDVELMGRGPNGSPDRSAEDPQSREHRPEHGPSSSDGGEDREADAMAGPSQINRPGEGEQLNVVV